MSVDPDGGRPAGPSFLTDPGIYRRFRAVAERRPAVFLDRDGVVVEEVGYLHKREDVRFIDGALQSIAGFNRQGWIVVLVTNQAGIARGYYGWDAFESVQQAIEIALEAHGGWFDGIWACGYHSEGSGPLAEANHPFRKPNPGMILDALTVLPIDAAASWLVGDKVCDLEAACRAGLAGAVHVRTGHGPEHRSRIADLQARFPNVNLQTAETLADAAALLLPAQRTI